MRNGPTLCTQTLLELCDATVIALVDAWEDACEKLGPKG